MPDEEFQELTEYFIMEKYPKTYYFRTSLESEAVQAYLEKNWDKFKSGEYVLCKRLEINIQVSIKGE